MAADLERVRISEAELRAEAAAFISTEPEWTEVQKTTSKKQWHREGKRPDVQLYQPGSAQTHRWREDTGEETENNNNPDPTMPCSSVSDQMSDHHLDCTYKEQSSDPQQTEGNANKDCTLSAEPPASQKVRRTRKPDREIYQPGGRRSHRESVQNKDQVAKAVTAAEDTGFERGGTVEHGEDKSLKNTEKKEEKEKEQNGKKGGRKKQTTGKPKNVDSTVTNSNKTDVEKITKRTEHLNIREEAPRNNLKGVDGGRGEGGKEKKEKRKARKPSQPENKERLQSVKVNDAAHQLKNNGEQINEKERDATGKNRHHDRNLQKARGRGDCAEDSNKETHRACWETEPRKEGAVTKRYSKSDIRRPRNRNYSTSSASSANSVDGGQGESRSSTKAFGGQETVEREPHETGGGKKTWSRAEPPRRWRDASTTDSLEETETWEGAREGDVSKNKAEKKNRSTVRSKGSSRGVKGPPGNRSGGLLKVGRQCETTPRPVEQLREQGRTGCGRGILVLPAHTELSTSAENIPRPAYAIRSGTGHGRERSGRGGSTRRLWDPNNPDKKPALTKNPASQHSAHLQPLYLQHQGGYAPLHFLDTDDETSPVCLGENFQTPYCYAMANYKYQNSENPYGYPVPGSTPPQFPFPTQFHYQIPGSNGMYPNASMAPLYEGFGRGRHGYHSPGTTNIAPEDTELLTRGELSKLLRRADSQEVQLGNLLSRERLSPEGLEKMAQLRTELLSSYERVILTDIEFSDSQNVDQLLWKNVFYQVIERFRQFLKDHDLDTAAQIRSMLLTLLDEGAVFFDSLLQSLQNTFQFKLEDYMDGMAIRSKPLKKTVKYALKSAQRCMICQGDIARYREQANNSANYGKARSWYLKAQQIAPKNGRPYNQLALLAVYTKRKLDAVYYYMRSLAASNPILTAKESLMSLFEEAKRKAEQMERRQKQDNAAPCGPLGQRISSDDYDSMRVEIWISPTRHPGITSHTTSNKSDQCAGQNAGLDSLSISDLNKRFILSFLHTHGKLFTKVGMENFLAVASCMLQEFCCILQHSPCPLGNTRLLQIITINMFTIYYAQDRAKGQGESRSVLEEQSTFIGLAMFGLLVQRCTELLEAISTEFIPKKSDKCEDDDDDDDVEPMVPVSSFQADLHELLPSVKVWSDWMLGHPEQWNPPPANLDGGADVWQCLADLCNSLARVYHGEAPLYKADADGEGDEELHLLVLEEDRMLAGFVPLLAAPQEPCYIEFQTDPTIAADCKRVTVLKYFLEALCGQEEPLLAFKDGKYVSIAMLPTLCNSAVNKRQSEVHRQSQEDQMFGAESSVFPSEGAVDGEGNEDDLRELRARRSALTHELAQQQKRRDKIQAVLQKRSQMELEIRPFYLVPDTNAFIDHLEGLKKLLACGTYVLVVPLIVITELDGLAKGKCSQDEEYVDRAGHARLVQEQAKAAVTFLEKGFEAREPGLRALTSRGNQLESIALRSEDTGHQGNNDDVILSCCLHYCKDKAKDFMPAQRDSPVRLFREVVLLTDDRNLRVKALTRNVPVRDIPAFLSWAKVG